MRRQLHLSAMQPEKALFTKQNPAVYLFMGTYKGFDLIHRVICPIQTSTICSYLTAKPIHIYSEGTPIIVNGASSQVSMQPDSGSKRRSECMKGRHLLSQSSELSHGHILLTVPLHCSLRRGNDGLVQKGVNVPLIKNITKKHIEFVGISWRVI